MVFAQARIRRVYILVAVVLATAVVGSGCADETGSDLAETASTTSSSIAATAPSTTEQDLAGVPYVGPGPREGDLVSVIGVAHDDTLPIRSGPGESYAVVGSLEPVAAGIAVTGRAQLLDDSIWYEVAIDGSTGWVDASYIGLLGGVEDLTAQVVTLLGDNAAADSMLDLGVLVARLFIGDESGGRVWAVEAVDVDAPTLDGPSVITADVIGGADDSVIGYRIRTFATPSSGDGPPEIDRVERTMICWRGMTADGICL